jgi:hypothetical protein
MKRAFAWKDRNPAMPPGKRARLLGIAPLLGLSLAMTACSPSEQLQVTYGEWELIEPGRPPSDFPEQPVLGKTIKEGSDAAVALGDLVEIHLRTTASGNAGRKAGEYDEGRGWYWIAFAGAEKTDFPIFSKGFAGALIGLRLGSVHTFADNPRSGWKGTYANVHNLPFGDPSRFYQYKPLARPGNGGYAYSDRGPGQDLSRIEITRICKGQTTQRLITLHDNTPISVSQDMFRTHETSEPRWMYLREAKWEGKCNDGKQASFRFGPLVVEPPPGKTRGLNISALWGPWVQRAWAEVPTGVVVK